MSKRKVILTLVISFVLAGCNPVSTAGPGSTSPVATPSATVMSTPAITATLTATATPEPIVRQYAVPIETGLPLGYTLDGVLVLREKKGDKDYLLDLKSMSMQPLPATTEGNPFIPSWACLTISPDRKRLAYLESTSSRDQMWVVTADGQSQPVNNWPDNWIGYVIGWLDNHRLTLVEFPRDDGTMIVFDPLAGEWQELPPAFPAISPNGELSGTDDDAYVSPFVIYDPTLSRAAVLRFLRPQNRITYELWDVQSKKILWERSAGVLLASRPVWSPDGERFAVVYLHSLVSFEPTLNYGKLYLIDSYGQETQLAEFVAGALSWSPDGRFIATWWRGPLEFDNSWIWTSPLAIVDVVTGDVSVYFFPSEGLIPVTQYPIWSPNGRYVAFDNPIQDETIQRVVILDVVEKRAFEVVRGLLVRGWMTTDP